MVGTSAARNNKSIGRAPARPVNVPAKKPEAKKDTRTPEQVDADYQKACALFDKAASDFREAADQKAKEIALAI